jgi:S-adenosylmethionine synthetase
VETEEVPVKAPILNRSAASAMGERAVEIVERKGLGHPDTICDMLMEAISVKLCDYYRSETGQILHHNLDKGLLVAGQSTPALRGGRIDAPMRIVFGDRATCTWEGKPIPINEIIESVTADWFRTHLRHVDPQKHLILQNEIHPGSQELTDIFARGLMTANDTSAAVGFAPLSETESIVLAAEQFLNSRDFKSRHPETGEDVKVMGVRRDNHLELTVAIAFVDSYIMDQNDYYERKSIVVHELKQHLIHRMKRLTSLEIFVNSLDDPRRGLGGMYLTVLGTSAEGADGGEVGRGNRVNGVISLHRPMTLEAAAGKNPVSHVGKIYNLLSHQMAQHIYDSVEGINEVYVWLCSTIGCPLDEPSILSIDLALDDKTSLSDVSKPIREIIEGELGGIANFTERLCKGEIPVC